MLLYSFDESEVISICFWQKQNIYSASVALLIETVQLIFLQVMTLFNFQNISTGVCSVYIKFVISQI